MNDSQTDFKILLQRSRQSVRSGDRLGARRLAETALSIAPDAEEPWLHLAAISSPRASLYYLNQALKINPSSKRARQGAHWAVNRLRNVQQPYPTNTGLIPRSIPSENLVRRNRNLRGTGTLLVSLWLILLLAGGGWFITATFAKDNHGTLEDISILAQVNLGKATRTPTFTPTFTPTSTPTQTLTPTPTLTPTITPTITPTPTSTSTPLPTNTPEPPNPVSNNVPGLPSGVDENDRWIDINLSEQRTYAYHGREVVNMFVVSTGTWQHPTVTGTYQVYVKYQAADMSGPGYYLPSVPYVMYFYQGYGLHGTYWHNNFGTPMSHGCVNLRTDDAGWLFDWASVGTIVNVHY